MQVWGLISLIIEKQLNRLYHRWRKEYAKTRTVPPQEDASGAAPAEASGLVPRPLIGAGGRNLSGLVSPTPVIVPLFLLS